ncbi:hypothetical protein EFL87_02685 [Weissella confusa]|uniref:hypothetical protein n=1 Tax=Weissella confusa TaxID=1583 RepID=UPI00223B11BA|nr:hypothetical protein [Weissella confusa]MCT0041405.1 hypothetical protein [Weissella confusa]
MHDTAIIFFFDEQGRRVPVFGENHFPFIHEALHESYVKMAPEIKEKELYALFEGKEFLVWPVDSNQAAWTSLILSRDEELKYLGTENKSTSHKAMTAEEVQDSMKTATSVNNGMQRRLPDAQQQSSKAAFIARLITGVEEREKEEYNKTTKPDGHEINLADDVKTFVHAVLTDEKTKSNPQLIAAVAELLEFFR